MWRQSEETVRSFNCIDEFRTEDPSRFIDMVRNGLAALVKFSAYFIAFFFQLCGLSSTVIDASEAENGDRVNLS